MKKILLLFVISFLLITKTHSQSKQSQPAPLQKSLLWEISGNGLTSNSYLFGTYHFAGKNFVDSLSVIGEKFKTCKAVAGEVMIDSSGLNKMAPAMILINNSLDKIFTPREYALIADSVRAFTQLELTNFNYFKPASLEIVLLYSVIPQTISPTNPEMDQYFQYEGKKQGDKIIGLETIEFQTDLLFNAPLEEQKRHLLHMVSKMDKEKKNSANVYRMYQQQDLEGINKAMFTDGEFTPAELDKLLKNRNLKWMDKLPVIIKDQPTFIAVGAAHLIGEYGLINQLRLKGYTVKPVKI